VSSHWAASGRSAANISNQYALLVLKIGLGILLDLHDGHLVHHGREHGAQGAFRRLPGHREHDPLGAELLRASGIKAMAATTCVGREQPGFA
jgi:hypothetical protein